MFLPTKSGGLGFQSCLLTSKCARAASWHACLPALLKHHTLNTAEELAGTHAGLIAQLHDLNALTARAVEADGPISLPLPPGQGSQQEAS